MSDAENMVWDVVQSYVDRFGLVRHQIESYEHFISHMIPHIVTENTDISVLEKGSQTSHHIQFCNVSIRKPSIKEADGFEHPIFPQSARLRAVSYCSSVLVDVVHDVVDARSGTPTLTDRRVYKEVLLCRVPVMLKSKLCYLNDPDMHKGECTRDFGGYFIINGVEKVLLAQEKLRTNFPYVFQAKGKYEYFLEVRSCHELKMRSTSTICCYITKKMAGKLPEIHVTVPFLHVNIPVVVIFHVLGIRDHNAMRKMIVGDEKGLINKIVDNIFASDIWSHMSEADLFEWIAREGSREVTRERRYKYMEHIVSSELLPHMGLAKDEETNKKKAIYFGFILRRLILVHNGSIQPDDRDHYCNKRIDTAGNLMSLLMRQLFRNVHRTLTTQITKLADTNKLLGANVSELLNHKRITSGFKYSFATGNWGTQKGSSAQTGVAQILSRMTTVAALANLRRINTPINRDGKAPKPRQLHYTSWGIICPVETPEGASCGLVRNMALMTSVRIGCLSNTIMRIVLSVTEPHVTPILACDDSSLGSVPVMVNGVLIGMVDQGREEELCKKLRAKRQNMDLPFDCSIAVSDGWVHVVSDAGCLLRPLIVASKIAEFKHICQTEDVNNLWNSLLRSNAVEYIDKQEEEDKIVALHIQDVIDGKCPDADYVEIDPSLIMGLCALLIPFSNHNQAPRNTYQSAMGKQAVSLNTTTYQKRMDTVSHVLHYPQTPLVRTRIEDILRFRDTPSGSNVIVAILCYTGMNQEDSVIMNQSSIERGMFRTSIYRTYKDDEKAVGADAERFENPKGTDCTGMKIGCYDKLNEDGIVDIGSSVEPGDVIIGKTITTSDLSDPEQSRKPIKRDKSIFARHADSVTVDAILTTVTKDGNKHIKVRTRSPRTPMIGDKFSSRHGQKGVIGIVYKQEEMPFTVDGITPDIIINPHAIPSRMTIGQVRASLAHASPPPPPARTATHSTDAGRTHVAQLMECILGKACALECEACGNGTPFRDVSIKQIASELERNGYHKYGSERLINGMTGKMMTGTVMIGPVYYQRLKHMVIDKEHARSRGPVQILTRQPVEGRSRDGGLRFGEMERDCVISHGASYVLKERLFEQSDPFSTIICQKCGYIARPASSGMKVRNTTQFCNLCSSSQHCVEVKFPFAFKLLLQEMMSMHISPRIRISNSETKLLQVSS